MQPERRREPMRAETFVLEPTVLVRVLPDRIEVVAAGRGEEEALIVFRGSEDARRYQESTGKHTTAEGFQPIGMDQEGLAALLETQGLHYVHMPEPWTGGDGGVDTFTAENFLRFLEQAEID